MPHVNKKSTSEKWKFNSNNKLGLQWAVNGFRKLFRKKYDPKNRKKNSKNQSEIAACEQKTTTEKPNFCSNTVFSLYFKFRAKKIHAAKPLAFSLHFLFRREQNHLSNLTSKIMKMCEQILKKRQGPNTIQILWIVKNSRTSHKNNSKNWMKNSDVLYLTSRSIEQWQPEHKQNHQKIEKLKESKLNKNIVIAKTLEAFKPKAKFFPFKKLFQK